MTINLSDNDPRIEYTVAQGVTQSAFVVPFEFFDDDDLNIYVDSVLQTLTTHYTTADDSGNTQQHTSGTTGYIHFTSGNEVTGATGGSDVVITRDIDIDRVTDFPTSGPFDVSSLNNELDRMIAISADIKDTAERALILQDYDTTTSLQLPDVATRANKILSFTATGDATVSQSIGIFQGSDATVTTRAYLRHDLVKSTTTAELNNVYIAMQDSPSGTSLTNTSFWALVVDAVSAATSAAEALQSKNTALGYKNDAETAKTAAETAATNAATTLTTFQNQYHGALSSDPSSNLDAGDLYFNTSDGDMRVYNGTAWINVVSAIGNLANIVEDSTPQLGGDLDTNGNDIVTTSNANLDLAPNGTGAVVVKGNTNPGTVIFNCEANTHGQTVKSQPHTANVTNTLTLPAGGNQEIVGTTATQTLTNKSIDGAQLTGSVATARLDTGTSANQIVALDGSAKLPAVDGSQLTNITVTETDPSALAFAIALG